MKTLRLLLVLLLCAVPLFGQSKDSRMLSESEYQKLLTEILSKTSLWEQAMHKIDPEKTNVSYSTGKSVVMHRDIVLNEIRGIRV